MSGRRMGEIAPLYRPGYLIIRLHRALNPAGLLVQGATYIEGWIERYLERHPEASCPQYRPRGLQALLHWLIEDPAHAREARGSVDHLD